MKKIISYMYEMIEVNGRYCAHLYTSHNWTINASLENSLFLFQYLVI